MKERRYPEGGTPPTLSLPNRSDASLTETEKLRKKRRNKLLVPVEDSSLSSTSSAKECFVGRKNSKMLQQFLLNYSYTIVTTKVLSGEV